MRTIQQAIDQVKEFTHSNEHVRALVFQGSLVMPNPKIDNFTDVDPLFYVDDIDAFIKDESWIEFFGNPIARFSDQGGDEKGDTWYTRLLLLEDGFKMDVSFVDIKHAKYANNMSLYKVIIDKDGIVPKPKVNDESNFYIKKPSQADFDQILGEFYFDTSYVVKSVRRNELFFTRYMFHILNKKVKAMLGWYLSAKNDYQVNIGSEGRYFFDLLEDDIKTMVIDTFAGKTIQKHFDALDAYFKLIGYLGREIEKKTELTFNYQLEKDMMHYVKNAKKKPLANNETIDL